MAITIETTVGTVACPVVRVSGEIDVASGPEVERTVVDLVAAGHREVVIDLGEVSFLDSSGIGALVACSRALGEGGRLGLARPLARVARVLDMTGVSEHITVHDSVEQAVAGR